MSSFNDYQFPFANYPAVRICILFISGIAAEYYLGFSSKALFIQLTVCILSYLALLQASRRGEKALFLRISTGMYMAAILLFGSFWYSTQQMKTEFRYATYFNSSHWEQFRFYGTVKEVNSQRTDRISMVISVDSVALNDSVSFTHPFSQLADFKKTEPYYKEKLRVDTRLHYEATIYPLEEKRNPFEFDYKSYLARKEIYLRVGIDTIYTMKNVHRFFSWSTYRKKILRLIDSNFDSSTAPLAKAILIGYKAELDPREKKSFSRAGLSHIMAVSGLHVGFIVAPFWLCIPFLWTRKYGRQIGLILLMILLISYAGITGFSTSVIRASLTAGFITYGKLFNKIRDSINLTAVAALLILIIDPGELFEIGFQLSFCAVFIILMTVPVLNHWMPDFIRYRWWGKPIQIVLVSAVVQIGLFPLLSYYFNEFSLIGPLSNALIVPFLGIMVPLAMALLPLALYLPDVTNLINTPFRLFLTFLKKYSYTTTQWEWSWLQTNSDSILLFLVWGSAILFISSLRIAALRWKMAIVFLLILVVNTSMDLADRYFPDDLSVTVFDVGQGDALLIETPNGNTLLVDTGIWSPGYNSGKYILLPHLKKAGIDRLNAVILTHPHADHIGGITDLIKNIPIDTVYNSGYEYDSELYSYYHETADTYNVPVVSVNAGKSITLDPSVRIFVLGPFNTPYGDDPNEHSVIVKVIYGENEFLFTGDAGVDQENRLVTTYTSFLDVDFLKVGHHGSRTSSSSEFLRYASPEIAVVSLGLNNRFSHPHMEALERLHGETNADIRFTSLDKALIFKSNGNKIRQKQWK